MIYTNTQGPAKFSPKQKEGTINKLKITEVIGQKFPGLGVNEKCKNPYKKFKYKKLQKAFLSIIGKFLLLKLVYFINRAYYTKNIRSSAFFVLFDKTHYIYIFYR